VTHAEQIARACYCAACPRCADGETPILAGDRWAHGWADDDALPPETCRAGDLRDAVAALLPEAPDPRDLAHASYGPPVVGPVAPGSQPWVEVARLRRALCAVHARVYGWHLEARGPAPLPPEQTPRDNRLAAIGAICELALRGESIDAAQRAEKG